MSAETIPAEVLYLIRKGGLFYRPNSQGYTAHTFDAGRYTLAEAEAITHPNGPDGPRDGLSYVPAPADRSTRPAEPAAPVAEAGEVVAWGVEMYGFWELCNDEETARYRHEPARKVEPLVRLSTLEAERARADAAEQRAADALARAEKTERRSAQPIIDGLSLANAKALVELFGGDETDMTVEFIPEGHSGPGFYAWCTEYPEDGADFLGPASEFSSRASREAQPATDGGDNG